MSAFTTIEPVAVLMLTWQSDHLGYTRCPDHVNADKGGTVYIREARSVLREADATGCTDPYVAEVGRAMWTCDTCGRHVTSWPTHVVTVNVLVEHTTARIF